MTGPQPDEALLWVERIAKYCADQDGLPMIAGRILGWLMICDPPEQSAGQIAEAIGASRASLTTNLRLLASVGFVHQVTKPGDRTVYYRVDDDAWETVVRRQIESLTALGDILRDGLTLTGRASRRGSRLRTAHEVFHWMARVFADAPPMPSVTRNRKKK
jgi:DNA-binding MarR family transcriptional regulator